MTSGSEKFLPGVTELDSCGFRLVIFFQDYSRNFLFLELISLSGGGEVIVGTLTSCGCSHLKKNNKTIESSEAFECVSD